MFPEPEIDIDDQDEINPVPKNLDRLAAVNVVLGRIRSITEIILNGDQGEGGLVKQELDHFGLLASLLEKHVTASREGVAARLELDLTQGRPGDAPTFKKHVQSDFDAIVANVSLERQGYILESLRLIRAMLQLSQKESLDSE
ncbi:hypothetical protein KJ742_05485 [Patescibacteria group bacterium]|nr:hypothetical protein [Patescibacteria group bacterium]MBU1683370.1 hypothetical protein [Patescibacteria group bacterium]